MTTELEKGAALRKLCEMTTELYSPVPARLAYEDMERQRDAALRDLAVERGRVADLERHLFTLKDRCLALGAVVGLYVVGSVIGIAVYLFR